MAREDVERPVGVALGDDDAEADPHVVDLEHLGPADAAELLDERRTAAAARGRSSITKPISASTRGRFRSPSPVICINALTDDT